MRTTTKWAGAWMAVALAAGTCCAQTYPNIEVLVSDNASTDDTTKVLRELCDKRLRVMRQETNIGLLPNWNACVAAAKGENSSSRVSFCSQKAIVLGLPAQCTRIS